MTARVPSFTTHRISQPAAARPPARTLGEPFVLPQSASAPPCQSPAFSVQPRRPCRGLGATGSRSRKACCCRGPLRLCGQGRRRPKRALPVRSVSTGPSTAPSPLLLLLIPLLPVSLNRRARDEDQAAAGAVAGCDGTASGSAQGRECIRQTTGLNVLYVVSRHTSSG